MPNDPRIPMSRAGGKMVGGIGVTGRSNFDEGSIQDADTAPEPDGGFQAGFQEMNEGRQYMDADELFGPVNDRQV